MGDHDEDDLPRVTGVPVAEDDEEEWVPHVSGVPVPFEEEESQAEVTGTIAAAGGPSRGHRAEVDAAVRLSLADLEEVPSRVPANQPPALPPVGVRSVLPRPPLPVRRPEPSRSVGASSAPSATQDRESDIDFGAVLDGPAQHTPPPSPPLSSTSVSTENRPRPALVLWVLVALGGAVWFGWQGAPPTPQVADERRGLAAAVPADRRHRSRSAEVASPPEVPSPEAPAPSEVVAPSEASAPSEVAPSEATAPSEAGSGARPLGSSRSVRRRRPQAPGSVAEVAPELVHEGGAPETSPEPRDQARPEADEPGDEERRVTEESPPTESPASLPTAPSREQVQAALSAVRPAVQACVDGHGTVRVRVSVARSGRVTTALVDDPYWARPPTGSCIARAVRTARFPAFVQDRFVVVYPFTL